jgi:hypothetical protein
LVNGRDDFKDYSTVPQLVFGESKKIMLLSTTFQTKHKHIKRHRYIKVYIVLKYMKVDVQPRRSNLSLSKEFNLILYKYMYI